MFIHPRCPIVETGEGDGYGIHSGWGRGALFAQIARSVRPGQAGIWYDGVTLQKYGA